MADNITLKRIVDLVAQTDVDETVYTIIDSVAGTVKKYPIGSLICSIAPIFDTTAAYAAGKYCNYNGQLYRFDEAHAAGSWTGSDATAVTLSEFLEAIGPDVDDLKEALTDVSTTLTHKADKDGTVASAEQLLSDVGTEDKTPYLFRAVPYDSTRVDEEVVGVSVGWNQLVGSDTSSVTVTSGHKLYTVIGGTASIVTSDGTAISVTGGTDMVVDLTAWFGTAIADYAYTLEQATAGAGVAFIKALLPSGYIPYSAPILKSVEGLSAHVMRGFNAWDEEWEVGGFYTATGLPWATTDRIRSKNYIPVLPDTAYYISNPNGSNSAICFYDANKTFISATVGAFNITFNTPTNAKYMRFNLGSLYGTTYKNDICINLSDPARNGTYEPYKATTYALDSDLTLRGILKLDASNHVYADGDRYLPDGTVTRKYGIVDLGSLTYITTSSGLFKSTGIDSLIKRSVNTNIPTGWMFCPGYTEMGASPISGPQGSNPSPNMAMAVNSAGAIFFNNTSYSDPALFKTGMSGVYLLYELTTPITETALPYASPQNCEPGGTEEYVYAEGGSGVLVGHNSKYLANLKSELERVMVAVPDAPSVAGTYSLKATVTAQGVTYAWVSD